MAAGVPARELPAGSETHARLEVDTSRLITARAYVPLLDEEFEHVVQLRIETTPSHDVLSAGFQAERRRFADVWERQRGSASPIAELNLFRIDSEQIDQDVEALIEAARGDPDAATAAGKRLLDLRAAIDAVEAWSGPSSPPRLTAFSSPPSRDDRRLSGVRRVGRRG